MHWVVAVQVCDATDDDITYHSWCQKMFQNPFAVKTFKSEKKHFAPKCPLQGDRVYTATGALMAG